MYIGYLGLNLLFLLGRLIFISISMLLSNINLFYLSIILCIYRYRINIHNNHC